MPDSQEFRYIGKDYTKVDGMAKVTGQTRYADDLEFPRMLSCKLLRADVPHARITGINTSAADAMPGVVATLTGAELPITFGILPVSMDEHALCPDRVRFAGDPVAAVAAIDEDTAFEAIKRIKVEYEELPAILDPEEAMRNDTPPMHDHGDDGNVHKRVSMQFGDLDTALEEADEVFEDVVFYQGNTHLAMEQHCAVALPEADGRITLWSSTQCPHYVHKALSRVLEMPPSRIRVIATPNGGGFGGKSDPFNHEIVVAKLALKTNRPVKCTLTREEVFYCHRGRHPVLMRSKLGLKKDGSITAIHFESLLDGGAYGSYGVASTYYTGALQTVTYKVPAYRFDGVRAFTNKPPCGPKRGHGTVQPRFALEIQIDRAAKQLGIDPAEFRLQNIQPPHSVTANWLKINTMGLRPCIEKVVEASGWKERHKNLPRGHGLGIACSSYITGAGLPITWNSMPHTGVSVKLDRGGGVTAFCGATDIGQGSDTVLAACVAEILGVDLLDVRVCVSDTDLTPVDLGSYSSRVTLMMGKAAIQAAERARDLVAGGAAHKLKIPVERVVVADNKAFDSENPEHSMTFRAAVVAAEAKFGTIVTTGSYRPPRMPGRYRGAGVGPTPTYSYSACVAEIFADEETGEIEVKKIWIGHDIGRAINRMLVIGQVEGGVYMGLGECLMEEMAYRNRRNGVHKIPSMLEYKSLTTMEMPEVETFLIEEPDPEGPFGGKEAGQGPLLPVGPAVNNALHDALGVRVNRCPMTPEFVLKALESKDKRSGPTKFPDLKITDVMRVKTPEEGGDGDADEPWRLKKRKVIKT